MRGDLSKRWYSPDFGTRLEVNLSRRFGTVGLGLTRNDEDGTLGLQLGFLKVFLSRDAWSWSVPGCIDEWDLSVQVHGGRLWISKGRTPYMRRRKGWPRSFALPWFEWKHVHRTEDIEHGTHPYTYQWKFEPGTVQHVTATVSEYTHTWQLRFAGVRLPWYRVSRTLWCNFSEEMGDRRDSYKGGATGAGFEIRKGEKWEQGYTRMQKERNFCRGY